jgi:hypothetical protein
MSKQHFFYAFLDEDNRQGAISVGDIDDKQTLIIIFNNGDEFFPEDDPELDELMDTLGDAYSEGIWVINIDDIDMISNALDAHGLIMKD